MSNFHDLCEGYAERYDHRYQNTLEGTRQHVSSVNTEMNVNWMRNNPELAVEAIINFFEENHDRDFNHDVQPRFVPEGLEGPMKLGYVTLYAKRKQR